MMYRQSLLLWRLWSDLQESTSLLRRQFCWQAMLLHPASAVRSPLMIAMRAETIWFVFMVLLPVVCFDAPSIAPALFTVNHFPRYPLENNPADVLREPGRVSPGPFAHTLGRLFGQRRAVVALFELA